MKHLPLQRWPLGTGLRTWQTGWVLFAGFTCLLLCAGHVLTYRQHNTAADLVNKVCCKGRQEAPRRARL